MAGGTKGYHGGPFQTGWAYTPRQFSVRNCRGEGWVSGWEIWIDRGGTFTDVVARDPDGRLHARKWLSELPGTYPDATVHAIRDLLGIVPGEPVPVDAIADLRIGTTVATNALLERKGARTLWVCNQGFADALRIGHQARPHLFDLRIDRPEPLHEEVLEVRGRLGADGSEVEPLDEQAALEGLRASRQRGLESVAITLMHAYLNARHERRLAELAREAGFAQVTTSHDCSPLIKYVPRSETTLADAYLSPVLDRYLASLAAALGAGLRQGSALFMQSSGGLARAGHCRGKDAVLSGPAGGVVGMVGTALRDDRRRLIGFDMGGTSTDVTHYHGELERTLDASVAGVRLRTPMMRVHTVAAGGGSILRYDGLRMQVGPESAGAHPGPACYGRGGPLTVTDANLVTGRLRPEFLPPVFGPGGDALLDTGAVLALFAPWARATGNQPEELAEGFLSIATDNMARAIKRVSVERGHDVRDYTLACFGGAGGQLACRVADALGMRSIHLHRLGSLLSAVGIGMAALRVARQRSMELELTPEALAGMDEALEDLAQSAIADLRAQQPKIAGLDCTKRMFLKYRGTDGAIEVERRLDADPRQAFESAHQREFGYLMPDAPVVVETLQAEAVAMAGPTDWDAVQEAPADQRTARTGSSRLFAGGRWHDAAIFEWEALQAGTHLEGPALVVGSYSTVVIEPGWYGSIEPGGHLQLERQARTPAITVTDVTQPDPVLLEIFNNRFMSIAEAMGSTLERTARSINIRERLDFSCALFDATGALVANAPHMPVHLGSMSTAVHRVLQLHPSPSRGDMYLLNDPFHGGTHLPDLTVIAPVHLRPEGPPDFFVAARGHHADVGGTTPGSMPADSTRIEHEGVLFDAFPLVSASHFDEAGLRQLLTDSALPARNPDQNVFDLRAQVAACRRGQEALAELAGEMGIGQVARYMSHVQARAAEVVRRLLARLPDGQFRCEMDGGEVISVALRVNRERQRLVVDFTGSSAQARNNFNAPSAVTRAAVLYVLRCLVDEDIPLNDGCLLPVELVIPSPSLLAPTWPAATVAGNVETSQMITDALLAAAGALAASQGTMNNLTFGNAHFQYYETICGGSGAGSGFHGTSAVQTHMTNSRMTDPEILEWRFPVRVERFAIRQGSGGAGRWRGGDGAVRRLRFLEDVEVSLLGGRRSTSPHGLQGGESAAPGLNRWIRSEGDVIVLGACARFQAAAGDALEICTPGGGGFGDVISSM